MSASFLTGTVASGDDIRTRENHTGTVVEYLARYSHRIATTNARLLKLDDAQVTFRYKNYRNGSRHKSLSLDGTEFVRRFPLHALPKGMTRIRHFGFLANRCRRQKLTCIYRALALVRVPQKTDIATADMAIPGYRCPQCRQGRLHVIASLPPLHRWNPGRRL